MLMKCTNCSDWEPEIAKVNAPILLQSARAGRNMYCGKPFVYCPWCGSSLEDDSPWELTDEPIDRATVEFIDKCMNSGVTKPSDA